MAKNLTMEIFDKVVSTVLKSPEFISLKCANSLPEVPANSPESEGSSKGHCSNSALEPHISGISFTHWFLVPSFSCLFQWPLINQIKRLSVQMFLRSLKLNPPNPGLDRNSY